MLGVGFDLHSGSSFPLPLHSEISYPMSRHSQKTWRGKVVLVTGGSSGLGLEISREFAARGAVVCLVARDADRLESAKQHILDMVPDTNNDSISLFPSDVMSDEQVTELFSAVVEKHGRLDVLVNNVGVSTRTNIVETKVDDFRELMETNFYTVVRCTQTALPELQKNDGHVVNIGSLASKTAWPFIAPYAASKHAVANYTHQLRLDGPKNVHYLLVCPGPIRRDDAGNRYSEQAADLPESARQPGAGAKLKGLSAVNLADRIVSGCEKRKPEIIMPFKSKALFILQQISTRIGDWMIRRFSRGND